VAVWVLVGNEENWKVALRQGAIWGVTDKYRRLWEKLEGDDILLFYCKAPIGGLIGVGTFAKAFKQDSPFWPDEQRAKRVIYPYRFEMNVGYVLPETQWRSEAIGHGALGLTRGYIAKGLNPLHNEEILSRIDFATKERFGLAITAHPAPRTVPSLDHAGVQEMLVELGSLQRFLSNREYPMDRERLDVAWRRVEGSVPTYVFEVQVGGDIHHALAKLKHAYDLWNSNVVLALGPTDMPKAITLLAGTFHEVRDKVKLVELSKIQELYRLKKQWKVLERSIGIF
jgi:predicted RNA-binding protein